VTRRALGHDGKRAPTMLFETYFRADRYYYSVQIDKRVNNRVKGAAQRDDNPRSRRRPVTSMRAR
jgi:hypothetical protein